MSYWSWWYNKYKNIIGAIILISSCILLFIGAAVGAFLLGSWYRSLSHVASLAVGYFFILSAPIAIGIILVYSYASYKKEVKIP